MKKEKQFRKKAAVLTAIAVLAASFAMPQTVMKSKAQEETSAYGLENPTMSDGVSTWDCVYFGNYWQNDTNGDGVANRNDEKQPIKWRVLSVNGDDAFLLADKNLEGKAYNEELKEVTWETCTLRTWLNSTFLNDAFSSEEQEAIQKTHVVNEDNPTYGTDGGNDTEDMIYLLSISEASNPEYGFDSEFNTDSTTRISRPTDFARERNMWWLRSPCDRKDSAAIVFLNGLGYGWDVHNYFITIRPVLHLNLSSGKWSAAGKVDSKIEDTPEASPTGVPSIPTPSAAGIPSTPAASATRIPSVPTSSANSSVISTASPIAPVTNETGKQGDVKEKITEENIAVKKAQLTKVNAIVGKKMKASWKKISDVDGYQFQCAVNKKFKNAKTITVKTTAVTVKKLKKKTYYVRVRAYKVVDGKRIYGKWSTVKKVKIRK